MFTHLVGYGIRSTEVIFKTNMFIFQSMANLDEKILFGKITRHLDPEIRKMMVMFGNENFMFYSGP